MRTLKGWFEAEYKGLWSDDFLSDPAVMGRWSAYLAGKTVADPAPKLGAHLYAQQNSSLADQRNKVRDDRIEEFVGECAFAKQVSTANGLALLIAGQVINISSSSPEFHVDALSRALRRINRDYAASAAGEAG